MLIQKEDGKIVEGTRAVLRAGCFGGEVIVVALENNYPDHRAAHPDKVLYAWPELPIVRELLVHDLPGLQIVHALKKEFKGWITPKLCEGFGRPPAGTTPSPVAPPVSPRRCAACGRPFSNSETARCQECEEFARAIGDV